MQKKIQNFPKKNIFSKILSLRMKHLLQIVCKKIQNSSQNVCRFRVYLKNNTENKAFFLFPKQDTLLSCFLCYPDSTAEIPDKETP